jgi:hypothetical protein
MGWVESPSLFCSVTESVRDITQHLDDNRIQLPHHDLEDRMKIQPVPPRACATTPSTLLQVHVDDFCHAATQSKDGMHIPLIHWVSIHAIHSVFPQPGITGHTDGKEPISDKKIDKGDGDYTSTKEMIGFVFDGIKRTIHLPRLKAAKYIWEIHRILWRSTIAIKPLQSLVGQLWHASIISPAARGFFTPINAAMRGDPRTIGLGKCSEVQVALHDLGSLLTILGGRPTHVCKLVIAMPIYVGYHDTAAEGAGGVWFSLVHDMPPCIWRIPFPDDIATNVVSRECPHGQIANSWLDERTRIGVQAAQPAISDSKLNIKNKQKSNNS